VLAEGHNEYLVQLGVVESGARTANVEYDRSARVTLGVTTVMPKHRILDAIRGICSTYGSDYGIALV
jgi:hypothetical protein